MSTNDTPSLPPDTSADHSITVHPSGMVRAVGGAWPPVAAMSPSEPPLAALNVMAYLHAIRRHWLMAALAGLICASVPGLAVWLLIQPKYRAVAQLRLLPSPTRVVFPTADSQSESGLQNAFDVYKRTQLDIIKSRFVMMAALRNPKVKGSPSIQREDQQHNALSWLTEQVNVGFERESEIMQVSITLPNPDEAANLVNAVVQAYFDEVVVRERSERRGHLSELQQIYAEKENISRTKRTELKQLAEQLGTTDNEALSLRQQIAIQQYAEYRKELTRMQFELSRSRGHLHSQQALMEKVTAMEVSEYEVAMIAQLDPQYRQLTERATWQRMLTAENTAVTVPGTRTPYLEKSQRDMQIVQAQFDDLTKGYRERIRGNKRAEVEKEIRKAEAEIAILAEQEQQFAKDVERQRKEADQIGRGSIDIEMMRADVKHVDQILSSIADERERLMVELRSAARVYPLAEPGSDPAAVPENETGRSSRLAVVMMTMLIGLCAPVFGIAIWDVRAGRINVAAEVSKGLGLPVLGSLPMIPARVIRRLGSPSKRNQAWRMRLTESVDGVVARLLRKAELEQTRVILITSAAAGEGKTTLATQLAMSLARNMRSTVLVDFDLRRPSLDGIFGLPPEPGVCEALRGQDAVAGMIHATTTEHLSVVTAGRWDRQVLAALSSGATGTLLEQLRAKFDFVILDSSPILPVADTRLVSQYVDAVVLSVFRDISQGPRVLAAYEILEAFGVRTIEAVVTGQQEHGYGKDVEYESSRSAENEPPAGLADGAGSPETDAT